MKKLLKTLLVLVVALSLFGCGEDHEGQSKTISSSTWVNAPYEGIVEKFKEAGFTNIKTEGIGDLITGWLNDPGDIDDIIVEGYEEYPSSKWIDSDTEILIQYHSFDKIDNDGNIVSDIKEKQDSVVEKEPEVENNQKEEEKFDIDENVILVSCERDSKYDTQYNIVFANESMSEYYAFDSSINPRAMGKKFNAIGNLPDWFEVGSTVHLQANLRGDGTLSQSKCTVTEAQEEESKTEMQTTTNSDIPVVIGVYLKDVLNEAANYGVNVYNYGDDCGDGTKWVSYQNKSQGLSIDICYSKDTNEIVYATIFTDLRATDSEQKEFIKGMSKVLCPKEDSNDIGTWVSSNLGKEETKVLNGVDYKVWVAQTSGCLLYDVNIKNWEAWVQ